MTKKLLTICALSIMLFCGCKDLDSTDSEINNTCLGEPCGGMINPNDSDSDTDSNGSDSGDTSGADSEVEGCEDNGNFYEFGETFKDADGCNSCWCERPCEGCDVMVACTMMACIEDPCESLLEEECTNNDLCTPIMGRNMGTDLVDCQSLKPEFAGCMSAEQGCGDAETFATDPDDTCWLFMSTCLPQVGTWTENYEKCNAQCQMTK